MKKRLLALLLSAAMLLSLTGAVAENADMPTITMWAGMSSNCPEETLHQGTIRDLLGINYTVEWTQGDFLTTLNMKINAGELPDICVFWNDTVAANALINSGLVQPVDAFVSDPEKYPNLRVRVSGFSGYFVRMRKTTQDEIIARTVAAVR